jgi:hypothetical protein
MQSTYSSSDQAAQVLAFAPQRELTPLLGAFTDNLDHLQALEYEAKLMLAVASMRRCQQKNDQSDDQWGEFRMYFPFLPPDATLELVQVTLRKTVESNRHREAEAVRQGVKLLYPAFCTTWELEPFERAVLLLLFMKATAPHFIDIFKKCRFEESFEGMEIGTLLTIIADTLRDQLECRRYFSVDASLTLNTIVLFRNHVDDSTNILDVTVCLHERVVRFILGDHNLYNSLFTGIKRERSAVSLDQVILPDNLKEEIETRVGNYLQGRKDGSLDKIDEFFGYGTALTLLFHGPSGTGKTMLAQGIANRFGRETISLNLVDVSERRGSPEDMLEAVFHEASMQSAIVFLDECDDLFENDSRISRALLIEIEKARCVIILATNKPVDLDPAMDRRIAMKVPFELPEVGLRLQMWQALIPKTVKLADDIDLAQFAERYRFSGGLIKNSVFMALASLRQSGQSEPRISRAELEQAANLQTASLSDLNRICTVQTPATRIDELPLSRAQRTEMHNLAKAWEWLHTQELGFNLLFNCSNIETGLQTVSGLAAACGMSLRIFDFAKVASHAEDAKVIDPVTQRKVHPMTAAFSAAASDRSLILFVDYCGDIGRILSAVDGENKVIDSMYLEMLSQLRQQKGLFCLVTTELKSSAHPIEFHQMVHLSYPPEELQLQCWEKHLGKDTFNDQALAKVVQQYPLHIEEIKYIARQAIIRSIVRSSCTTPDMKCLMEVLSGYRKKVEAPVLFGGERHGR